MNVEIRREKLEGGGYGEYIDMWITANSKSELCAITSELLEKGYNEAIEEVKHADGSVCWYFAVNDLIASTVKEVREDYKEAKLAVKEKMAS